MEKNEYKRESTQGKSIYNKLHVDSRHMLTVSISLLILSSVMLLPAIYAAQPGSYLSRIGTSGFGDGELKSPSGIAIDSSGNIYVTDTDNNRVEVFLALKNNSVSTINEKSVNNETSSGINSSDSELDNKTSSINKSATSEVMNFTKPQSIVVPSWIKNNAKWWSQGQLGDEDFVKGIQYLIQEGIMKIPHGQSGANSSQKIPLWVKNNAGWWASGQISDDDFVKGIQYLITNGLIKI